MRARLAVLALVCACSPSRRAAPKAEAPGAGAIPRRADAGPPPAPPADVAVKGAVRALAAVPAWDIAAGNGRLVVIDSDFLSASALDTASGAPSWRLAIETEVRGRHTLHGGGARLLEWAGETLHVIDAPSGRETARAEAPFNGSEWNQGGCGLDVSGGACAWRCQCTFQVFDCATGKPAGKRYEKLYVERFASHGPPTAGCWGGGGDLIGQAGDLALFSTEDHVRGTPGLQAGPIVTAAVSLASGKEVWRDAEAATPLPYLSGVSPDASTCWLSGISDALRVLDCASGKALWQAPPPPDASTLHLVGFVAPHGIYELAAGHARLRDERTGKLVWDVALPGALAWPRGAEQPVPPDLSGAKRIALLDPATGQETASLPLPADATVLPDRGGAFFVVGPDVAGFAADGKLAGRASLAHAGLTVGDDFLIATLDEGLVVLSRRDLTEVGRVAGKFEKVLVEGALGRGRAAAFHYDGQSVGRVILLRLGK